MHTLLPAACIRRKAQTLYRDQVRIEKESITRNEDNNVLSIDMDIVMQENLKLSSNHVVTLTPFLESNGRTKILPSIVVYGRKREVVNQRNNIAPSENTYSVIRRKHNKEQIINYHQQFQFEAWMRDAEMKLNIDVCGCCDLKEETSGELITRLNILPVQLQPAISYITPQAEAVKHRAIEGKRFPRLPGEPNYHPTGVSSQHSRGWPRYVLPLTVYVMMTRQRSAV